MKRSVPVLPNGTPNGFSFNEDEILNIDRVILTEPNGTPIILGKGGTSDVTKSYVDAADLNLQNQIDGLSLNKVDDTIYQTDKTVLIDDIDNLIIDVASLDDLKADKITTYTKTETDTLLDLKVDKTTQRSYCVYTEDELALLNDMKLGDTAIVFDLTSDSFEDKFLEYDGTDWVTKKTRGASVTTTELNNELIKKVDKTTYNSEQTLLKSRVDVLEETKFLEVSSLDAFTGTVPTTLTLLNLQNGINSIGGIVMGADGGISFPANGTYDIRIRYNVVNSTSTNKTLITGVGTTNLPASIIKNRTETQVAPFNSGIAQTQTLNIKVIITNFATEKRYVFVNSSGSGTMNYVNNTVNSPISIVVTR